MCFYNTDNSPNTVINLENSFPCWSAIFLLTLLLLFGINCDYDYNNLIYLGWFALLEDFDSHHITLRRLAILFV